MESNRSHFVLHVFAKLRRPLPLIQDQNPTALIPDQTLIPLLLNRFFHQIGNGEYVPGPASVEDIQFSNSRGPKTEEMSSGTFKLQNPTCHVLNESGRFGRPLYVNPALQAVVASESSVLDSPPSRRTYRKFLRTKDISLPSSPIQPHRDGDGKESPFRTLVSRDEKSLQICLTLINSPVVLAPLQVELFLMVARVLEQIVQQCSNVSILHGAIQHPNFASFVKHVASNSEPFIHGGVVRIFEAFCAKSLSLTSRRYLREVAVTVLECAPTETAFVLELLLVTLGPNPVMAPASFLKSSQVYSSSGQLEEENTPNYGDSDCDFAQIGGVENDSECDENGLERAGTQPERDWQLDRLDSRGVNAVLDVFQSVPLRTAAVARAWAFAFRILRIYCDPDAMLSGPGKHLLDAALASVLIGAGPLVSLIENDVFKLVKRLLRASNGDSHAKFQQSLFEMLVQNFQVASPLNQDLYRKVMSALSESFARDKDPAGGLSPESMVGFLEGVSTAIAIESRFTEEVFLTPYLENLCEALELVCEPLRKSQELSGAASLLRKAILRALTTPRVGRPAPIHCFLEWLSNPPQASIATEAARLRLSEVIVMLLSDVLGREEKAASPLIDMCVSALRDPHAGQPEPIAAVIEALIKREALANHLVLSRAGVELGIRTSCTPLARTPHQSASPLSMSVSRAICETLGAALPGDMSSNQTSRPSIETQIKQCLGSGAKPVDVSQFCKLVLVDRQIDSEQDEILILNARNDNKIAQLLSGPQSDAASMTTGLVNGDKKTSPSVSSFVNDVITAGTPGTISSSKVGFGGGINLAKYTKNKTKAYKLEGQEQIGEVQHIFKGGSEDTWSFTVELPNEADLHSATLELRRDVPLDPGPGVGPKARSALPSRITMETGNSIARLSPTGVTPRLERKQNLEGEGSLGLVQLLCAAPVATRFVRITVYCPASDETSAKEHRLSLKKQEAKTLNSIPQIGTKVERGPDWKWGLQDGGANSKGEIVGISSWAGVKGKAVRVKWESGRVNAYRWGYVEDGIQKYDLCIAADEDSFNRPVVILSNISIKAAMLQPQQHLNASGSDQRSLSLFLELCAKACRNFNSVQQALAASSFSPTLASTLIRFLPGSQTSSHARAIIVLLARRNNELAFQLLAQMLGPIHTLTSAHAALAAELSVMQDAGTQDRLSLLWRFVAGCLKPDSHSPLMLPFLHALAISIEHYSLCDGGSFSNTRDGRLSFAEENNVDSDGLLAQLFRLSRKATGGSPAEHAYLTLLCALVRADSSLWPSTVNHIERLVDEARRSITYRLDSLTGSEGMETLERAGNHFEGNAHNPGYVSVSQAQSALKIVGVVTSCDPQIMSLCSKFIKDLGSTVLPLITKVQEAELKDIEGMAVPVPDIGPTMWGGTPTRATRFASQTDAPRPLFQPKTPPPRTPSKEREKNSTPALDTQSHRLQANPFSPGGTTPSGTPSRRLGWARALIANTFGSRKQMYDELRSIAHATLHALSNSSHAFLIKDWLGSSGLLEQLLTQLSDLEKSKLQAQREGAAQEAQAEIKRKKLQIARPEKAPNAVNMSRNGGSVAPPVKLEVVTQVGSSVDTVPSSSTATNWNTRASICESWSVLHDITLELTRTALNLHAENQLRVAHLLVSKMALPDLADEFLIKLFSEMVTLAPRVALSLWRPNDVIEHIVDGAILGSPAQFGRSIPEVEERMIRLDPKSCGSTISISDDGLGGTQVSFEKWGMVRADTELPMHGVSSWDVSIDLSPKGHIFVGVATSSSNLNSYLGNDRFGWGYIGNRGAWHNKHKVKTYGKDFRTGHVVTVTMNMDEGVLSFALNGEPLGVAFDEGLKDRKLFPAFALYQNGDRFTITRCSLAKQQNGGQTLGDIKNGRALGGSFASTLGSPDMVPMIQPLPVTSHLRFHRPGPVVSVPGSTTAVESLQVVGLPQSFDTLWTTAGESEEQAGTESAPLVWDDNRPSEHGLVPVLKEWAVIQRDDLKPIGKIDAMPLETLIGDSEIVDFVSLHDTGEALSALVDWSQEGTDKNDTRAKSKQPLSRDSSLFLSPVITGFADLGGLPRLINLAKAKLGISKLEIGLPGQSSKTDASKLKEEISILSSKGEIKYEISEWVTWLDTLAVLFKIPGYPRVFVENKNCMGILMSLLNSDLSNWSEDARNRFEPSPEAFEDLFRSLISSLSQLFEESGEEIAITSRQTAARSGVLDRVLLQLGKAQSEDPRRPSRTQRFDTSYQQELLLAENSEQEAPSADETLPEAVQSIKAIDGSVLDEIGDVKAQLKVLWTPGYGTGRADTSQSDRQREQQQREKLERTLVAVDCMSCFLDMNDHTRAGLGEEVWAEVLDALDASCILRILMSFFFEITIKVVVENDQLYHSLLRLVYCISCYPQLGSLLVPVDGIFRSIEQLLQELEELVEDLSDGEEDNTSADAKGEFQEGLKSASLTQSIASINDDGTSQETSQETLPAGSHSSILETLRDLSLKALIETTSSQVKRQANAYRERKAKEAASAPSVDDVDKHVAAVKADADVSDAKTDEENADKEALLLRGLHDRYQDIMKADLFHNVDMADAEGRYVHHYRTQIEADMKGSVSKNRMRRLNREFKSLRKSLPLHYNSSVALRVDTNRPFVAQCAIFGPDQTPYDSGCFIFDIYFPPDYPTEPPKMNLMTTGNGSVRFNPNLYNNGKVCLSLLGTWRGGATGSENWTKNSSLWQVLVSIQSAILGSEFPYFNEPGVESQWGTAQGDLQKRVHANGGYERLRVATIQYAMIGHLRSPPHGMEELIRNHFRLKKRHILETVERWLKEAEGSDTKGHCKALAKQVSDLRFELDKLGEDDQIEALFTEHAHAVADAEGSKGDEPLDRNKEETGKLKVQENEDDKSLTDAEAVSSSALPKDLVGGNVSSGNEKELENSSGAYSEGEKEVASALDLDKPFYDTVAHLQELFYSYPIGLLRRAVELTKSQSGAPDLHGAITWVQAKGEDYLTEHLELYQEK